jgi:cell fate (sporulation/competence/biofilm development) regulator YlbF (YheA/YmcA/DUF963 family)
VEAKQAVEANEESKALYAEFKKVQEEMHQKMMAGEMPGLEDQEAMKRLNERTSQDASLSKLLQAQQAYFTLVDDLQKTIFSDFSELF